MSSSYDVMFNGKITVDYVRKITKKYLLKWKFHTFFGKKTFQERLPVISMSANSTKNCAIKESQEP